MTDCADRCEAAEAIAASIVTDSGSGVTDACASYDRVIVTLNGERWLMIVMRAQ